MLEIIHLIPNMTLFITYVCTAKSTSSHVVLYLSIASVTSHHSSVRFVHSAQQLFRGLLPSSLCVSVPLKTRCGSLDCLLLLSHNTDMMDLSKTRAREGFNVKRQQAEELVHSHSEDSVLNRCLASRSMAIIHGCLHRDTPFFPLLPN